MAWDKKYVLVISWWGTKGLYACGILKAMEELGLRDQIEAIYGVSAGALTGAYWASGWKSEDILERFLASELFSFKNIALPPKMSLLRSSVVEDLLKQDIKPIFEELSVPLYVGLPIFGRQSLDFFPNESCFVLCWLVWQFLVYSQPLSMMVLCW